MGERILVTGALGQIGSDLVPELRKKHFVIASDIKESDEESYEKIDVLDKQALESCIKKHKLTTIYHLASLLSATGEKNPDLAWTLNTGSLKHVLDLARDHKMKVFWPSSIAVFGPTTPKVETPQRTVIEPTTMYGVTKLAGEGLCNYYFLKYGVDVRSLRYPGLISWKQEPGGGTTDYAVDIFYHAVKGRDYTCFVHSDTVLPMMYMDDAIRGTIELMEADPSQIRTRTSYNFAAMSFSAEELAEEIQKHVKIKVDYVPDHRQKIANTWPQSISDSRARTDWHWKPEFDLKKMTEVMLKELKNKQGA